MLVLNKADALDDERARASSPSAIPRPCWSPRSRARGWTSCGERIAAEFERTLRDVELLVPFSEGGTAVASCTTLAGDLDREDTADGVRISARLPSVVAERYDRYAVNGDGAGG